MGGGHLLVCCTERFVPLPRTQYRKPAIIVRLSLCAIGEYLTLATTLQQRSTTQLIGLSSASTRDHPVNPGCADPGCPSATTAAHRKVRSSHWEPKSSAFPRIAIDAHITLRHVLHPPHVIIELSGRDCEAPQPPSRGDSKTLTPKPQWPRHTTGRLAASSPGPPAGAVRRWIVSGYDPGQRRSDSHRP